MVCDVRISFPQFPLLVATAEAFVMGKIHKEIAMFMLEASEDGTRSEQSFVKVHICSTCMCSIHHTML